MHLEADSEARYAFAAYLRAEVLRLENDPKRIAQVGRALRAAAKAEQEKG